MKTRKISKKISKGELAWRISIITLSAIFLYCIVTYLVTPFFMIQPHKNEEAMESVSEIDEISEISVEGEYSLSGYLLDREGTDKLLIYFYGIADDAASSMLMFYENEGIADYDIAVIDWPGYGENSGTPSCEALKESAAEITSAFINTLNSSADASYCSVSDAILSCTDYSCSEICIMGYSLGTGPSVYAASLCGCSHLYLLAPYCEAADLYNGVTPVFYGPMKSLLGYKMDTYKYAAEVSAPVTIMASKADKRVSYDCSLKLSECFPNGCEFITLEDIAHGNIPKIILKTF